MLKPFALLLSLLLCGCAMPHHRQTHNGNAPPACRSHDSEISCIWENVPDYS